MTSYDSDSSIDDGDYTETGVLLGYASKETTDDTISHLGGSPQWLDTTTAPPGNLAKCKVCNGTLSLLLELNGDLPERFPGHERRLYLFGCRRKPCRRKEGSMRGFRATRASKAEEPALSKGKAAVPQSHTSQPPPPKQDLGSSIFGGTSGGNSSSSANPFASSSASSGQSNPFSSASTLAAKSPQRPEPTETSEDLPQTFAAKARIAAAENSAPSAPSQPDGPSEPWPSPSAFPPPYPHYHLDADYETLEATAPSVPANARVHMDIDGDVSSSSTTNGATNGAGDKDADKEAFESAMDRTFQRFADRVAQNPEQVLRYEFGGTPLLYSKDDAVGRLVAPQVGEVIAAMGKVSATTACGAAAAADRMRAPRCVNCGARRVFELQLMPKAIEELEAEEEGLEGMDWGTVMLMVCERDCLARGVGVEEVGYVEEWVGVQWEEVVARK